MTTLRGNLTERFKEGLLSYDLTQEEIIQSGWKYCGGNKGSHRNYWDLVCGQYGYELPKHQNECVCGHHIEENCYITDDFDDGEILILGMCCIKKFCPKSGRTCEICGEEHRNRIVNRCNDCRIGLWDGCRREIDEIYTKCYRCKFD